MKIKLTDEDVKLAAETGAQFFGNQNPTPVPAGMVDGVYALKTLCGMILSGYVTVVLPEHFVPPESETGNGDAGTITPEE